MLFRITYTEEAVYSGWDATGKDDISLLTGYPYYPTQERIRVRASNYGFHKTGRNPAGVVFLESRAFIICAAIFYTILCAIWATVQRVLCNVIITLT